MKYARQYDLTGTVKSTATNVPPIVWRDEFNNPVYFLHSDQANPQLLKDILSEQPITGGGWTLADIQRATGRTFAFPIPWGLLFIGMAIGFAVAWVTL